MKTIFTFISAASLIVLNAGYVFAQRNDDADACAGCGICGGTQDAHIAATPKTA